MYLEDAPMELGQTLSGTSAVGSTLINTGKLGLHYEFPEVPVGSASVRGGKSRTTGHTITAVLLRNTSGSALLGQRIGQLDVATGNGMAVYGNCSGYSVVLGAPNIAVIDDLLPSAGVADDDLFWGIISGPQHILLPTVRVDHSLNIVEFNPVVAATGQGDTGGRISNVTVGNDTGAFAMARGLVGVALTGSTSHQSTGVTVLVNVQIGYRL